MISYTNIKSINNNGHTFDLLKNDLIYLSNANNLNDLYEGEFFYDVKELFYYNFEPNFIKQAYEDIIIRACYSINMKMDMITP